MTNRRYTTYTDDVQDYSEYIEPWGGRNLPQ